MAGMSQRYELQNAHSTKFLNYGHLGTITYDEETKGWNTLRIVKSKLGSDSHTETGDGRSAFPVRHLSSRVVYDGLSASPNEAESERNDSDLGNINVSSSRLANTSNLAAETEIRTRNRGDSLQIGFSVLSGKQTPNCSTLIALGSALSVEVDGLLSETIYVQIVASVSSVNAQSVRLVRIGNGTINKPEFDVEASSLHVPCVSNEDQAYWISSGAPVQQVCFAATTGHSSTWMAARLQNSTTIFHPLLRREPVPPRCEISQSPFQALPSSVLDTNPIVTIPILRTGGHPHADVCFHPKDHSRLALIDEHGNWSVWLVDGERQESIRPRFWVTLICFGKIWTWDHEKRLRTSLPYHDGWHRISWCAGSDSTSDLLFMFNRRTAALYKTSGDLLGIEDLHLGHAREDQCILDVQPSRVVPGHYFVLTSTRLFWLYFKDTEFGKSVRAPGMPHVLLAWQHFRDRGDRTLHLVVLETGLNTVVLMVSRIADLVLVFRFALADSDIGLTVSLADPLPIFLPKHLHRSGSPRRPTSLLFCPIAYRREPDIINGTENPSLFKILSLYEDLSIVEHLYLSTEPGFGSTAGVAVSSILSLPNDTPLHNPKPKSHDRDLGDFVVPDDRVTSDQDPTEEERVAGPTPLEIPKRPAQTRPSLDWQDIYDHLTDKSSTTTPNARIKVDAISKQLSNTLHQPKPPGLHLLSEFLTSRLQITDVDDDSEQFESLMAKFHSQPGQDNKLERLEGFPPRDHAPGGLAALYEAIVRIHLTPLSTQLPDRVRVNKERLARRVAADILVASTVISPISSHPADFSNQDTIPERATSQPTINTSSATSTASRPSSLPITTTTTTTPPTPAPQEDPILTCLRKYTTISPTPPISITTNPTLTSILRHLPHSPHTNPTTYSHRATERTLAAEQEEETALAAAKADPSARKKAEKARTARLRTEERRRRAVEDVAASSQRLPPRVVVSSRTAAFGGAGAGFGGGDGREVQSSQVRAGPAWDGDVMAGPSNNGSHDLGSGHEVPMSQPERGVFGTRQGVGSGKGKNQKEKGRKRAAGF